MTTTDTTVTNPSTDAAIERLRSRHAEMDQAVIKTLLVALTHQMHLVGGSWKPKRIDDLRAERGLAEKVIRYLDRHLRDTEVRLSDLEAEVASLQAERDAALREMSKYAREAGEAIGKLEISEIAGVVEGWKDRALKAETEVASLRGAASALMARWPTDQHDGSPLKDEADALRTILSKGPTAWV